MVVMDAFLYVSLADDGLGDREPYRAFSTLMARCSRFLMRGLDVAGPDFSVSKGPRRSGRQSLMLQVWPMQVAGTPISGESPRRPHHQRGATPLTIGVRALPIYFASNGVEKPGGLR